ncbi:pilus assembly protein PilP [Ferrimonas futtsuensis]|uniref:pilus assembly protein PilP n=1 Tax=Ferrimonas futtsuensis TaxID=364764 RepID=UPI00040F042E|nr:pilus assembly protein PilP [Ferrimonas futtsuensis]
MKRGVLLCLGLLAGCGGDLTDLEAYVRQVQANPPPFQGQSPTMPSFHRVNYEPGGRPSPFVDVARPGSEARAGRPGCLGPLPGPVPPLARVALDSLSMRGTLMEDEQRWALIQSSDGRIHRVKVGDRLGLFGGRVERIGEASIELTERVEQGMGCYVERQASLSLPEGESL